MTDDEPGLTPVENAAIPPESPPETDTPTVIVERAVRKKSTKAKTASAARKPARATKKKRTVAKRAVKKPAVAKPTLKKPAVAKAAVAEGVPVQPTKPPDAPGIVRVKAGGVVVWLEPAIAAALTGKDRKRLKAVLKRAKKRLEKP
jgi:hypothetical protein